VSTETKGQLAEHAGGEDNDLYSVFLPTTPNPTSGYLLFVRKKDVVILDMSVEEAAKVVISAGLVIPDEEAKRLADQSGIPAGELPPALLAEPHPDDGERRKNPETADG
jgi:uncharacterized membrane protein